MVGKVEKIADARQCNEAVGRALAEVVAKFICGTASEEVILDRMMRQYDRFPSVMVANSGQEQFLDVTEPPPLMVQTNWDSGKEITERLATTCNHPWENYSGPKPADSDQRIRDCYVTVTGCARCFGGGSAVRRCHVSEFPAKHHSTTSIACTDYMLRGNDSCGWFPSVLADSGVHSTLREKLTKWIVRHHFTFRHCHGQGQGVVSMRPVAPKLLPIRYPLHPITSALSRSGNSLLQYVFTHS
ncbi:hypothetical protein DFH07DRAFT_783474 [Mycena maculata]|uniref:Uncharacterized protein n=1 Tax=Mycena maculata TaxID=230809 RepID=A0AAD7MN68_9AGAR|nr:hypothetical protein DFH07DRAFT_783474 [Mycena maculata]